MRSCRLPFLVVCLLSLVAFTGCATFKRKFVRPSRAQTPPPVQLHYEEKEYKRPPNRVLYEEAFSLWRIWHAESANSFDLLNRKRIRTSLKEALAQLTAMRGLLQEKKAQELSRHIERLQQVEKGLERETQNPSKIDQFRMMIEQELRQIDGAFSLDRVGPSLLPDS